MRFDSQKVLFKKYGADEKSEFLTYVTMIDETEESRSVLIKSYVLSKLTGIDFQMLNKHNVDVIQMISRSLNEDITLHFSIVARKYKGGRKGYTIVNVEETN